MVLEPKKVLEFEQKKITNNLSIGDILSISNCVCENESSNVYGCKVESLSGINVLYSDPSGHLSLNLVPARIQSFNADFDGDELNF